MPYNFFFSVLKINCFAVSIGKKINMGHKLCYVVRISEDVADMTRLKFEF